MSRIVLVLVILLSSVQAAAAADQLPYGSRVEFSAFRNGQRIGVHRLMFEKDADRLTVMVSIDLAVKVIGITAYRYSHRSRETWSGDRPLSFESTTDDNGSRHAVGARWDAQALHVRRSSPGASDSGPMVLPSALLPSTHWNMKQLAQGFLMNAQKGTKDEILVRPVGREAVDTLSGKVDATRYRYEGAVRMDQWFDDRGRWVKMRFLASDGSTIDYVLQE